MSNRNTALFQKSLLAVAVLSLSACSTTPRVQDYDLSQIGEGILKAGRTTAEVSERVWDRTTYLLGFSDGDTLSDDALLMDEVDIAMAQKDGTLPSDLQIQPVSIPQAIANVQTEQSEQLDEAQLALDDTDVEPIDSAVPGVAVVEDLVHEVASAETLWDIAKMTTGDANNWHVLADVNNLPPNAAVFPGQQLIIPSDMVKPDYFNAPQPDVEQARTDTENTILIDTQNIANSEAATTTDTTNRLADASPADIDASQRLVIPENAVNEQAEPVAMLEGPSVELKAGETLWDFAKRTTGDATNWQAIASHNSFSEKQAVVVRAGQSIRVPGNLLKPDFDLTAGMSPVVPQAAAAEPAVSEPAEPIIAVAEPVINLADETAVDASSELLTEASTLDETQPLSDETAEMTIVEATFKSDSALLPESAESDVAVQQQQAMPADQDTHHEIMVSGTYYPKAVYNDADFSSSLLMRVSPGTTLQVSNAMGNWFEVETEKGVGYVHRRDVK